MVVPEGRSMLTSLVRSPVVPDERLCKRKTHAVQCFHAARNRRKFDHAIGLPELRHDPRMGHAQIVVAQTEALLCGTRRNVVLAILAGNRDA